MKPSSKPRRRWRRPSRWRATIFVDPHRPRQPGHVLPHRRSTTTARPPRSPSCPASTCPRRGWSSSSPTSSRSSEPSRTRSATPTSGVNPTNDGNLIRISVPQLTEERRRELVKQAKSKGEDAKVSVRNIRRKAMEELYRIQKDGEAGEDEVGRAEKELDKTTAPVRRPDRRTGQAQGRRVAGGLVRAEQRSRSHRGRHDPDPLRGRPRQSRAARRRRPGPGRATCPPRSPWASVSASALSLILRLRAAGVDRRGRGRDGRRHPRVVTKRLRDAGLRHPGSRCWSAVRRFSGWGGRSARPGCSAPSRGTVRGLHDLAAVRPRAEGAPAELPPGHRGHGVPRRLDPAARRVRRADGLSRTTAAGGCCA